ncbi:MAG TPA: protein-glutamate O-methyltransferase CheR [Polyangia bacterium]
MEPDDIEVMLLLDAIAARYGHDLRGYRQASLRRRVHNALMKSGASNLGDLQHRLIHDPGFFSSVLDDLTVQVSDMFRDPEVYQCFRSHVVPLLRTYPQLRIWHAGCSSGEELYATAIILAEEGLADRTMIYATDLSPRALGRAREGVYDLDRAATFAENYRAAGGTQDFARYFSTAYDRIAFADSLRKNMVFFQHDLGVDESFGEMHAIFCRNVLIYFDRELRTRVLTKFTRGLCHAGFLVLGASEQLGHPEARLGFVPAHPNERIYRYRGIS